MHLFTCQEEEKFCGCDKICMHLEGLTDTSGFWRENICDGGHRLSRDLEMEKYKTLGEKNNTVWLAAVSGTHLGPVASKVKLRCASSHGRCLWPPPSLL